jgi:hypothetical protein
MAMIDDLGDAVARAADLSPDQAGQAVAGMLRFMAARLPSPLFGELQARLRQDAPADGQAGAGTGALTDALPPRPALP